MRSQSKSICQNILSTLFTFTLILFITTFSISIPIYFRPFYYAHINSMQLAEMSGFTDDQIRDTYNSVVDYLSLPGKDFSTGDMKYSPAGKEHFADCKRLFTLNTSVLFSSTLVILVFAILKKFKLQHFNFPLKNSFFWAGSFLVLIPLIIGGLASLNFDYAFIIFHKIFFPKKSNWIFDPDYDEIIRILPQEYFMNCAILIGICILFLSVSLIITALILNKKDCILNKLHL